MMESYDFFIVNAFSSHPQMGNPAGVVMLPEFLSDEALQAIAFKHRLPETAFIVKREQGYAIRWFSMLKEMDICGHATLAAAFVIHHMSGADTLSEIIFEGKKVKLLVEILEDTYTIAFDQQDIMSVPVTDNMQQAIGCKVTEAFVTHDRQHLVLIVASQEAVENLQVRMSLIKGLAPHGVTVTTKGDAPGVDYVLRYFAPNTGNLEDPVTATAQARIAPLWFDRTGGQTTFLSQQLSGRGGELLARYYPDSKQIEVSGKACLTFQGRVSVE